ncbi:MAG: hypothetical protein ACFWT6_01975 [Virgibacillus proomii]
MRHLVSLPTSVWIIYVVFIAGTLLLAIVSNARDRLIPFAYLSIILSIATPLIGFLYSIGRPEEVNELTYLFSQMWNGSLTAIFIFMSHLYLLVSLGLFIKGNTTVKLSSKLNTMMKKIKSIIQLVDKRVRHRTKKRAE